MLRIGYRNLLEESDPVITASSEASPDMVAENLGAFQPGENFRLTTLTGAWAKFNLSRIRGYGLFVPLYLSATPTKNLLVRSDITGFDSGSPWSRQQIDPVLVSTTRPQPPGVDVEPLSSREGTATGEKWVEQVVTLPTFEGGDSAAPGVKLVTFSLYVKREDPDDWENHVRLRLEADNGTDFLYQNFDLDNGTTQGALTAGGNWTGEAARVTSLGTEEHPWRRIEITARVGWGGSYGFALPASIKCRIQYLSPTFQASYTGDDDIFIFAAPQLELHDLRYTTDAATSTEDAGQSFQATKFERTEAAGAGLGRFKANTSDSWTGNGFFDTGWHQLVAGERPADWGQGWIHGRPILFEKWWHWDGNNPDQNPFSHTQRWSKFYPADEANPAGVLDVGAAYLGPVWQPTYHAFPGAFSVDYEEPGDEERARGGQLYQPIENVSRVWSIGLEYLKEDEAREEAEALARLRGRSRPVVVLLDENETKHAHESILYGKLAANPSVRYVGSAEGGRRWSVDLRFRELTP